MRGSRSLLFAVRPQTTNIGNDLIELGLDGLLEATWREPADIVELPAAGPSGRTKPFGLSARSMHEANQLADAVVVGGGNLLENGGLHLEPGALAALRAPLALVGISHGRVWRRDGQLHPRTDSMRADDVRALCAAADPLLVRDVATAERLADLGVGHAVVAGCPALFLDRFVRDLPDADPDLASTALLSVRNPRLMSVPYADQGRVRDDIRRLIAGLGTTHERVALLCHDFEDLAFAAEFGDVEVRYTEQPQRFLSWIRGCALSVGYRLHAFVSAVALDRPALHISYDERGASMIATLGLEAFDVPMPATRDVAGTVLELVGSGSPRREAQAVLDTLHDALVAGAEALEARAFAYAAARHTVL